MANELRTRQTKVPLFGSFGLPKVKRKVKPVTTFQRKPRGRNNGVFDRCDTVYVKQKGRPVLFRLGDIHHPVRREGFPNVGPIRKDTHVTIKALVNRPSVAVLLNDAVYVLHHVNSVCALTPFGESRLRLGDQKFYAVFSRLVFRERSWFQQVRPNHPDMPRSKI